MAGGQQFTSAQGTLGKGITIALVGIAITAGAGNLTASQSVSGASSLTGQVISAEIGSQSGPAITPSHSIALVGQVITSGQGSLSPRNTQPALTSTTIQSGIGFLSAEGDSVTVYLSGVEATFDTGFVERAPEGLVGSAATFAAGSVGKSSAVALVGTAAAFSTGTLSPGIEADDTLIISGIGLVASSREVALVGEQITAGQGTLTADRGLVGIEITSAAGTISPVVEVPLFGQVITSAQEPIGAPGYASLTGIEMVASAGTVYLDEDRSYALVGQQMAAQQGNIVSSALAFVTGQLLRISQEGIGPRTVALDGIEMTAGQGVLSIPTVEEEEEPGSLEWIIAEPAKKKKEKKRKTYLQELDEILEDLGKPEVTVGTASPESVVDEKVTEYVKKELEDDDDALLLASL